MGFARPAVVVGVVALLGLGGCTGGTTPPAGAPGSGTTTGADADPASPGAPGTPTGPVDPHPALDELVVSTSGLGPLTVGVPPEGNPGAAMLEWDVDACAELVEPGAPAGLWVASGYGAGTTYTGEQFAPPFFVEADDEAVHRIDLMVSEPATAEGIRIGSTVDELRAAYPELEGPYDGPVSRVWWLADDAGSLVFETQGDEGGLRPAGTEESVVLIRVLAPEWAPDFATANSGDVAGACPF